MKVAIIGVAIFLAGLTVVLWLCSRSRRTIPPTHHATGVLYASFLLAFFLAALLLLGSLTCLRLCYETSFTVLRVAAGIVLGMTPVILLLSSRRLWLALRGIYRQHPAPPAVAPQIDREVGMEVEQLVSQMALPGCITLATLPDNWVSPRVTANASGSASLLIPQNLTAMCMVACHGNKTLGRALLRLILAHELSHVSALDIHLMPLLAVFRVASLATAAGVAFILFCFRLAPDSATAQVLYPAFFLCGMAGVLALMAEIWITRVREATADASASLFVTPSELSPLLMSDDGPAPLERFLFSLSSAGTNKQSLSWSIATSLNFGMPRHGITMSITRLRELTARRQAALTEGTYLLPKYPWRQHLFAFSFAMSFGAIFYICVADLRRMVVIFYNIPHLVDGKWDIVAMKTQWGGTASMISTAAFVLAPLSGAIAASLVLCLPLRDSFSERLSTSRFQVRSLIGILLMCGIATSMLVSFAQPLILPAAIPDDVVPVSIIPCWGLISFVGLAAIGWVRIRQSGILDDSTRLTMLLTGKAAAFAPLAVVTPFAFQNLSTPGSYVLMLVAMCVASLFWHSRLFSGLVDFGYLGREWLDYRVLLRRKQLTVIHPSCRKLLARSDFHMGMIDGIVKSTIPPFALAAIGYRVVLKIDSIIHASLDSGHAGAFSQLIGDFSKAANISTLDAQLGLVLLAIFILLTPWMLFGSMHDGPTPFTIISKMCTLSELSSRTVTRLLPKEKSGEVCQLLESSASGVVANSLCAVSIPCFKTTCDVMMICHGIMAPALRERMTVLVMRHAGSNGGFGCEPGALPDPLHTFAALRYLAATDQLTDDTAKSHLPWLKGRITAFANEPRELPAPAILAELSLLLECVTLFPGGIHAALSPELRHQIFTIITQAWHRSTRSICETRDALVAAQCLDTPENVSFHDEVRTPWFELNEPLIVQMDPKTQLEPLLNLVEIAAILHPDNYLIRDTIRRVASNLQKVHLPG